MILRTQNILLANVIEQIYNCRNTRLVLSLSFRENVITYKLSNNPLLYALNSSSKPSGSHTHLTKWLNKLARNEIEFSSIMKKLLGNATE